MSEDGRKMLKAFFNEAVVSRPGGPRRFRAPRGKASSSGQQGEPLKPSSNPDNPLFIETPGVSFSDLYGREAIESGSASASTPTSRQPGWSQTAASPASLLDEMQIIWGVGRSRGPTPHASPVDSSSGGLMRQSNPGIEQAHHPRGVDVLPGTAIANVTAAQQSTSSVPGRLDDRELGILESGLVVDREHIRSVSDAAIYIGDGVDVERVRPYVHVVGGGEEGGVELTEFGRRELEARRERERAKRSRHKLIHHPTTPLLRRFEMNLKQAIFDEGKEGKAGK
jgi:hypothetical protein